MASARRFAHRASASLTGLGLLILSSVGAARAVTYVQMPDEALYEQADLIAEVTILRQLPALAGGAPLTEYYAVVENVIKGGSAPSWLVLGSPGGKTLGGDEFVVPGAPRFEEGARVLAFLTGDRGRGHTLLHLGMGAFVRVGTGPRAMAVRPFAGASILEKDLEPAVELARGYDSFVSWLERRNRGAIEEPDYFVARTSPLPAKFRLVNVDGLNVRWFDFDDGKTIDWRIRNTGSSNTQPQFVDALDVWSRAPVSMRLASGTNSTAGFLRSDGINAIIFGDPNGTLPGTFVCPSGGIVGTAGFWFNASTGRYEGTSFRRIREADIVINDGADCLLNNNRRTAAELFTRELGFSLGIGFSDQANATMSEILHDDGRGAFLTADDIAALETLYGKSSGGGGEPEPEPEPDDLAAPRNLKVKTPKPDKVRLRWRDKSDDETGFEIWRRIGERKWKLWETKGKNKKKLTSRNVKPGKTYTFRVRAVKDDVFSAFSNEVTVTMPPRTAGAP